MQLAIVNSIRTVPTPGLRGTCPNCESSVLAKCGKVKIWHWSHFTKKHCDHWWESETDWHRDWKERWPVECREISHVDSETGERHVADVKMHCGSIFEFQHSPMKLEERESREKFYKNITWVVDGTRNLDRNYFYLDIQPLDQASGMFLFNWWGVSRFIHFWSQSPVPVFLDFRDGNLWQLLKYDRHLHKGVVRGIEIEDFMNRIHSGSVPNFLPKN